MIGLEILDCGCTEVSIFGNKFCDSIGCNEHSTDKDETPEPIDLESSPRSRWAKFLGDLRENGRATILMSTFRGYGENYTFSVEVSSRRMELKRFEPEQDPEEAEGVLLQELHLDVQNLIEDIIKQIKY